MITLQDLQALDWREYKVIGPLYFWKERHGPGCDSVNPGGARFSCTRPNNHEGYHVGLAGREIMEIW